MIFEMGVDADTKSFDDDKIKSKEIETGSSHRVFENQISACIKKVVWIL